MTDTTKTARDNISEGLDIMHEIVEDATKAGDITGKEGLFIATAAALTSLIGGAILDVADAIREAGAS